jgi:ketosteroid isomerase-like protein
VVNQASEDIEAIRRIWDAWDVAFAGEDDAFLAGLSPEVEWVPLLAVLEGRVYRGHDGVREWLEELRHAWEVFEPIMEEFQDLGDGRYLVLGRWRVRARTSGVELQTQPASWLIQVRERKVARLQTFTNRQEALEVADRLRAD